MGLGQKPEKGNNSQWGSTYCLPVQTLVLTAPRSLDPPPKAPSAQVSLWLVPHAGSLKDKALGTDALNEGWDFIF